MEGIRMKQILILVSLLLAVSLPAAGATGAEVNAGDVLLSTTTSRQAMCDCEATMDAMPEACMIENGEFKDVDMCCEMAMAQTEDDCECEDDLKKAWKRFGFFFCDWNDRYPMIPRGDDYLNLDRSVCTKMHDMKCWYVNQASMMCRDRLDRDDLLILGMDHDCCDVYEMAKECVKEIVGCEDQLAPLRHQLTSTMKKDLCYREKFQQKDCRKIIADKLLSFSPLRTKEDAMQIIMGKPMETFICQELAKKKKDLPLNKFNEFYDCMLEDYEGFPAMVRATLYCEQRDLVRSDRSCILGLPNTCAEECTYPRECMDVALGDPDHNKCCREFNTCTKCLTDYQEANPDACPGIQERINLTISAKRLQCSKECSFVAMYEGCLIEDNAEECRKDPFSGECCYSWLKRDKCVNQKIKRGECSHLYEAAMPIVKAIDSFHETTQCSKWVDEYIRVAPDIRCDKEKAYRECGKGGMELACQYGVTEECCAAAKKTIPCLGDENMMCVDAELLTAVNTFCVSDMVLKPGVQTKCYGSVPEGCYADCKLLDFCDRLPTFGDDACCEAHRQCLTCLRQIVNEYPVADDIDICPNFNEAYEMRRDLNKVMCSDCNLKFFLKESSLSQMSFTMMLSDVVFIDEYHLMSPPNDTALSEEYIEILLNEKSTRPEMPSGEMDFYNCPRYDLESALSSIGEENTYECSWIEISKFAEAYGAKIKWANTEFCSDGLVHYTGIEKGADPENTDYSYFEGDSLLQWAEGKDPWLKPLWQGGKEDTCESVYDLIMCSELSGLPKGFKSATYECESDLKPSCFGDHLYCQPDYIVYFHKATCGGNFFELDEIDEAIELCPSKCSRAVSERMYLAECESNECWECLRGTGDALSDRLKTLMTIQSFSCSEDGCAWWDLLESCQWSVNPDYDMCFSDDTSPILENFGWVGFNKHREECCSMLEIANCLPEEAPAECVMSLPDYVGLQTVVMDFEDKCGLDDFVTEKPSALLVNGYFETDEAWMLEDPAAYSDEADNMWEVDATGRILSLPDKAATAVQTFELMEDMTYVAKCYYVGRLGMTILKGEDELKPYARDPVNAEVVEMGEEPEMAMVVFTTKAAGRYALQLSVVTNVETYADKCSLEVATDERYFSNPDDKGNFVSNPSLGPLEQDNEWRLSKGIYIVALRKKQAVLQQDVVLKAGGTYVVSCKYYGLEPRLEVLRDRVELMDLTISDRQDNQDWTIVSAEFTTTLDGHYLTKLRGVGAKPGTFVTSCTLTKK